MAALFIHTINHVNKKEVICEQVFLATSAYAKASADKKNTKATKE